jgi:hypothetical protein
MPSKDRKGKRKRKRDPVVSRFVIPLAGLLTIVSARLFELAGDMPNSDEGSPSTVDERPAKAFRDDEPAVQERPMKDAAAILVIGFFTALFIILCAGFGGMNHKLTSRYDSM